MTDPSHTLSDIPDEGDPAASRTTTPENAPEPQPAQEPEVMKEPVAVEESTEAARTSEAADTSSSGIDGGRTTSADSRVMPSSSAALGFPEGEPQSLHPAHLKTQLIGHWITVCVMSFAAFTVLSGLTLAGRLHGMRIVFLPGLAIAAIGLIAWWGWRYSHIEHRRTSFVISAAGCEIRRGVLWRRIITVPLSRIQHTDVTQGPLQRAYGLATLALYTAGTEHAKVDLSGLAFETAMAIRQYLFERSEAHDTTHHAAR